MKQCGDTLPFPAYWNRTIAVQLEPIYNFTQFVPQGVVINLGNNDYSAEPYPSQKQFESAYIDLVQTIRKAYGPEVIFFMVCGPLSASLISCPYVQNVVQIVGNSFYIDISGLLTSSDVGVSKCIQQALSHRNYSAMAIRMCLGTRK